MYNLYFNGVFICPISSFREYIEFKFADSDEIIRTVDFLINEADVPVNFDLSLFESYFIDNSIKTIEVKNDKSKKTIYTTSSYKKLNRVQWSLDEDTFNGIDINKIYITLVKGGN